MKEKEDIPQNAESQLGTEWDDNRAPRFDPENARKLKEQYKNSSVDDEKAEPTLEFSVDPRDYPIFARQHGVREDKITKKMESRQLSINETLGLMVKSTAETVAVLSGEEPGIPKADHVVYLDKSARPVSWLVDDFWDDFSDEERPSKSFLAIDRRNWFPNVGIELDGNDYFVDGSGNKKLATGSDFWRFFNELPVSKQKDYLARIRALYIEGGIESEDPDVIMTTPTILDGKNLVVIDEVSRSGSTLEIAKGLLERAIGTEDPATGKTGLKSVNGHVFWSDTSTIIDSGEKQMGNAPVWYPQDSKDWRGRGVKDINQDYYNQLYEESPTDENRALRYGALVLGEPLKREDEPGDLSWKLREEMRKMHTDYQNGHILPSLPTRYKPTAKRIMQHLTSYGVEFAPADKAKPKTYINLMKKRNQI